MKYKTDFIKLILTFLGIFYAIGNLSSQRIMENFNRGLVAVRTSENNVFISWRMLASDDACTSFNIYRDNFKINNQPVSGISNYTDSLASDAKSYKVIVLNNNLETNEKDETYVTDFPYLEIPLNIPASVTYKNSTVCTYSPNDCSTGDLDGDGSLEIIVKWDPSNSKDNSRRGMTGNVYLDAYKLNGKHLWRVDLGKNIRAGAHYTQFLVADFDGNGISEVVCKTAPGTIDGKGEFIHQGDAASADHSIDYRNSEGYILNGPEYLTVFNGTDGSELATCNYFPVRGNVSDWGDDYGNRVDRFLAGIAWLDGILPSIVMCRGYYTRATVAAWDFRNGKLANKWIYDSGTTPGIGLYGQGNHNLSTGDIDQDGKDEIIWGAGALDDNGELLYRTGLGHGDAMHLSDLDPDRAGLEVWTVHENKKARYGQELHDARTGEIIWGTLTNSDNGRGLSANISNTSRGFEMWSASVPGIANCKGEKISDKKPSINFRIYWDGDPEDELLNGNSISKFNAGNLLTANGCSSNNSTKSTPNLSADLLGDWREELVLRTSDNSRLRIYTTTIPTKYGFYTLMQDDIYRNAISWQNTAYNQPPHTGFYMGSDMDTYPPSAAYQKELRWNNGLKWDKVSNSWLNEKNQKVSFENNQKVLFDLNTIQKCKIEISEKIKPYSLKVNSPSDISFWGNGDLQGNMYVYKMGSGKLIFENNNSYSGKTDLWAGTFINNGKLSDSEVFVYAFATIGGRGEFFQINTFRNANIQIGENPNNIASVVINKNLNDNGGTHYFIDMDLSEKSKTKTDFMQVKGDWIVKDSSYLHLSFTGKKILKGNYKIGKCNSFQGDLSKFKIEGLPDQMKVKLSINKGDIILNIRKNK